LLDANLRLHVNVAAVQTVAEPARLLCTSIQCRLLSKVWHHTWHNLGHFGDDGLQVWWPNQQCQSIEGGWL